MQRIVFFVENGIGFGHIRRALLVAYEIRALDPSIDIVFISQASSLALLQASPFRAVNFPFVHRLPNNAMEHAFRVLLNQIVADLEPTLMVEDTYPSEWYLGIPALQDVPKILMLRRITPFDFDDLRRAGYFSVYDRILMVQEEREFFSDSQIPENRLLVRLAGKFDFVGPVFHVPETHEIDTVRAEYLTSETPLVVVNAGAGGALLNDAYCEHLFASMIEVARRCLVDGVVAHFVFVLGPYYRGALPQELPNTTIARFEPRLSALLRIAKVAVIRPGLNVTYEALSGSADVILVPGISYMEDQFRYTQWLREHYGVFIAGYENADHLFELIRDRLRTSSAADQPQRCVHPGQNVAAALIIRELNRHQSEEAHREEGDPGIPVFLLIGNIPRNHSETARALLRRARPHIALVSETARSTNAADVPNLDCLGEQSVFPSHMPRGAPSTVFLQASSPMNLTPGLLAADGIEVILYTSHTTFGVEAKRWREHYSPEASGILDQELYHFVVTADWERKLSYRISKDVERGTCTAIFLDLSLLTRQEDIETFSEAFERWLSASRYRLLSLGEMLNRLAIVSLSPSSADYGELEIDRLR